MVSPTFALHLPHLTQVCKPLLTHQSLVRQFAPQLLFLLSRSLDFEQPIVILPMSMAPQQQALP